MKYCSGLLVCILAIFCLLSCGLDGSFYISHIPEGSYDSVSFASITLPVADRISDGRNTRFTHFAIYYRIYMSGEQISVNARIDETLRASVHSQLQSDFQYFYRFTDITTTEVNTSNLEATFSARNYFKLSLFEGNMDSLLTSGFLEINFPSIAGEQPSISMNGNLYTLQRAILGPGINFIPQPNIPGLYRTFLNHPALYDSANATRELNADVANNTRTTPEILYTYVSMYIMAIGLTIEMPPRTIYSQPTFLGIFMLPNWS
ncbi:MAG: hypothetical protein FWD36_04640 [Treponema sp.]|nr:hypothetical protein [Treponema sp.]